MSKIEVIERKLVKVGDSFPNLLTVEEPIYRNSDLGINAVNLQGFIGGSGYIKRHNHEATDETESLFLREGSRYAGIGDELGKVVRSGNSIVMRPSMTNGRLEYPNHGSLDEKSTGSFISIKTDDKVMSHDNSINYQNATVLSFGKGIKFIFSKSIGALESRLDLSNPIEFLVFPVVKESQEGKSYKTFRTDSLEELEDAQISDIWTYLLISQNKGFR